MPMVESTSVPDRFRRWYDYERDCNAKTLAMLESVPRANRSSQQFQRAIDKMAHLVVAREIWLHRLGEWPERPGAFFPPGHTLDSIRPWLASIENAWTAYLARLDDAELIREFKYPARDGTPYRWIVIDLLTQVFGHAWYHRGQIATLVKDLGGTPVDTDYIFWCGTCRKVDPAV
jgi:uncharacterized damage-inducible protein DinB